MGLFTKRRPYTLHDHSRDYATEVCRAPEDIADAYASYIVAEDAEGTYGEMGANHAAEWPAWCDEYLEDCPRCGSSWGLCFHHFNDRECLDCGYIWDRG